MSKAAELANLIGNINAGGGGVNRNLIINGAMQLNQRGSYTITTTGSPEYGGPDRFHMWSYTSTEQVVGDVTQSTDVPSGNGFAYSRKFDVTTAEDAVASGEVLLIGQFIEAQNAQHLEYGTSSAKAVTMSFWIKSTKTGTYCFFINQEDGSRIHVKEYTVDASDTWEKKTITIPGDASGTINNDTGRGLWCGWVLMAGADRQGTANEWRATSADYATSNQVNAVDNASNNIYITGVQLEIGQNATEFEHEPFAITHQKCQRYCQIRVGTDGANGATAQLGIGNARASTAAYFQDRLQVKMRTAPSLTVLNATNFYLYQTGAYSVTALAIDTSDANNMLLVANVSSGLTSPTFYTLGANNANAKCIYSSEL